MGGSWPPAHPIIGCHGRGPDPPTHLCRQRGLGPLVRLLGAQDGATQDDPSLGGTTGHPVSGGFGAVLVYTGLHWESVGAGLRSTEGCWEEPGEELGCTGSDYGRWKSTGTY